MVESYSWNFYNCTCTPGSSNLDTLAFLLQADIRPQTDGCNGLRYNLTADIIESIFRTYPAGEVIHLTLVIFSVDMVGGQKRTALRQSSNLCLRSAGKSWNTQIRNVLRSWHSGHVNVPPFIVDSPKQTTSTWHHLVGRQLLSFAQHNCDLNINFKCQTRQFIISQKMWRFEKINTLAWKHPESTQENFLNVLLTKK